MGLQNAHTNAGRLSCSSECRLKASRRVMPKDSCCSLIAGNSDFSMEIPFPEGNKHLYLFITVTQKMHIFSIRKTYSIRFLQGW